jgi:hypothetical protein
MPRAGMEPRSLEPSQLLVMMMNIMMNYHSILAATDALKTATICVFFFVRVYDGDSWHR